MNRCLRVRFVFWTMALLLVLLPSLLLACQRDQSETATAASSRRTPPPNPQPLGEAVTVTVQRTPLALRNYSGEVRAKDQVAITAKISGRIEELRFRVGDKVKAGEMIAVLEHQTLDAQVRKDESVLAVAEANLKKIQEGARPEQIAIAQAALDGAKAKLEALLAGPTKEQIDAEEAAIASAQAKLSQKLVGPTQEQIKLAESKLELARKNRVYQEALADINLNPPGSKTLPTYSVLVRGGVLDYYDQATQIAMDELEALKAPPSPESIAELKAAVDAAKARLAILTTKPKPSDVAQLQSAINAAQAQLELARAPYIEYDLVAARAAVTQAQANLQLSRAQQAEAFLRSPVDGFIASRDMAIGALASPGTAVVTVVSQEVEVVFSVEEKGLGQVTKGMPVAIGTWASQEAVRGEILSVAPAANRSTRTFDVYVAVNPGTVLVPGMFVNVALP